MTGAAGELERTLAEELQRPVPDAVQEVAARLRARHGATVAAVLFYGSCLRKGTTEGVLDFYVLVDSYRAAYGSRGLALANALLPPNVFYRESMGPEGALRAKVAVISTRDFARATSLRSLDGRIWARFCQPAALVYARDEAARDAVARSAARAVCTMVERARIWLPGSGDVQRFSVEDLWNAGFQETYRAELRSESDETVRSLYTSDPERYQRVTPQALRALEAEGRLRWREEAELLRLESSASARRRGRWAWRIRRPAAKGLAVLGLLKTAATFGDWVPYALWKIERHSGVHIQLSERQRRHPFLLGWPVLFRLLRTRVLR